MEEENGTLASVSTSSFQVQLKEKGCSVLRSVRMLILYTLGQSRLKPSMMIFVNFSGRPSCLGTEITA